MQATEQPTYESFQAQHKQEVIVTKFRPSFEDIFVTTFKVLCALALISLIPFIAFLVFTVILAAV